MTEGTRHQLALLLTQQVVVQRLEDRLAGDQDRPYPQLQQH